MSLYNILYNIILFNNHSSHFEYTGTILKYAQKKFINKLGLQFNC